MNQNENAEEEGSDGYETVSQEDISDDDEEMKE